MSTEHFSYLCLTGRHGECQGYALGFLKAVSNEPCDCPCHVKAITREDVPQKDQFIDKGER